jgi:hypothetical protein
MRGTGATRRNNLLFVVPACAALCLQAQAQKGNAQNISQIKLEKFGWLPHSMHKGEYEVPGQQLVIDRENRVLVGFTVRENAPVVGTKEQPHLSFRILRFDTQGKLDLSLDVPTNSWHHNGVYLDSADDIIAQAYDRLQVLIASDETKAREGDWKVLTPCGFDCDVRQSLTRGTLVLEDRATGAASLVLQGIPPRVVKRCSASGGIEGGYFFNLTDTFAYAYHTPRMSPAFTRWPFCDFAHRSELHIPDKVGDAWAIDDNSFLGESRDHLVVFGADGRIRSEVRKRLAKHEEGGTRGQVSANGNRVAIIASTWRGGFWPLDIGSHMVAERVVVYEMATGKQLVSLPVSPMRLFLPLAISLDGNRVAFLVNGTLTIADAP